MIEIGKIKEGMTGRQVADLLYDNFLAVISGLGEYATEKWVTDKGYITKASLNGYATEKWVTDKGYITKASLNGYATEQWVKGRGYITASAVAEGYATIASVNELAGGVSESLTAVNTALAERVERTKFAEYFNSEMAKWFVKDDANKGIKPVNSYGLYSDTYVSAKGVSTGTGGSGGGSSYDRLDKWSDYTSDKAGWVLSALLGQDLNNRLSSLESGSALSLVTTGDGNAVTAIAKSGNQLTVTKGSTFQSLITSSSKLAYSLISGVPTSLPASDVAAWAKAASKPSYAFSEITNKPTTLSGYGITDAYTATTIDSKLGRYLPLSGGTISGDLILDSTTNSRWLQFQTGSGAGYIGYRSNVDNWYLTNKNWSNEYIIIHSGNIGSQSVVYATTAGDSDMLGGVTHSNYMISIRSATQDVNQSPYTAERPYILRVGSGNANLPAGMQYGNIAHFSGYGADTAFELFGAYSGQTLLYRCGETNEMFSKGWKTIAFTDSNVASATKLQTPRSIWGQSFDGTGNVDGTIVLSANIGSTGYFNEGIRINAAFTNPLIHFGGFGTAGTGTNQWTIGLHNERTYWALTYNQWSNTIIASDTSGNVGIGTNSPTEKLHVAGNIVATGSVTAKSSSDYRLKCAFDYNVDYQERLLSLGKVCDFNYTPHAQEREFAFADDKRHTSVIWQDARKANITGFCSVEEDGYGTINPLSSDLIFTIVGAIQQGIVKTERIEERVVRLEKENRELKEKINLLEGGRYGC